MEQETIVVAEEPQVAPAKHFCLKSVMKWVMSCIRFVLSKNGLQRILPWLLILLCVGTFVYECTNYYKTPIKYSVKISNQETYDIEKSIHNGMEWSGYKRIMADSADHASF